MSSHMVCGVRVVFEEGSAVCRKAEILREIERNNAGPGSWYYCATSFEKRPRENGELFVCAGCAQAGVSMP